MEPRDGSTDFMKKHGGVIKYEICLRVQRSMMKPSLKWYHVHTIGTDSIHYMQQVLSVQLHSWLLTAPLQHDVHIAQFSIRLVPLSILLRSQSDTIGNTEMRLHLTHRFLIDLLSIRHSDQ